MAPAAGHLDTGNIYIYIYILATGSFSLDLRASKRDLTGEFAVASDLLLKSHSALFRLTVLQG